MTKLEGIVAFAAMLAITGCVWDDAPDDPDVGLHVCEPIAKDAPDRERLEAIEALGFCASTAVDDGDAYIVEGDVVLSKASLLDKQARTSELVGAGEIQNVTVRVDGSIPTGGTDDWRTSIQTAINTWNDVTLSSVHLVLTTNPTADINIVADGGALANNVVADARFPDNGLAGNRIRINLDFNNNTAVTEQQKVHNMVHELGHCVGFRHTNWAARGESTAIQIDGTPATDSGSVMNGGTALNAFAGLTTADITGVRTLYPARAGLHVEYVGCTNHVPQYTIDWSQGSIDLPVTQWELQRLVSGNWTAIYTGPGHHLLISSQSSVAVRVRGTTSAGVTAWRSDSAPHFDCSVEPF